MQAAQQDTVTIAEAAAVLGVSADTVRRRIRRGELAAMQVHTPNGPAWRVTLGALPSALPTLDDALLGAVHSAVHTLGSSTPSATSTLDDAPGSAHSTAPGVDGAAFRDLVALVDRLQRENRDLAGLVGSLQQRLVFADERIRALEAPREPDPPETAPQRAPDDAGAKPSPEPTAPKRPWWRLW